jgi:Tol biopolymer transport system component
MRPFLCVAVGVCATVLPGAAVALPGASQPSELVFSSTFAGNREIFASAADGSNRVDLSKASHADITPAWSADGKRIAFASDRSGSRRDDLVRHPPGGRTIRPTGTSSG